MSDLEQPSIDLEIIEGSLIGPALRVPACCTMLLAYNFLWCLFLCRHQIRSNCSMVRVFWSALLFYPFVFLLSVFSLPCCVWVSTNKTRLCILAISLFGGLIIGEVYSLVMPLGHILLGIAGSLSTWLFWLLAVHRVYRTRAPDVP